MPKKNRLSLEVSVNGRRRALAVLPGKGVVQAWVVAERVDSPDRVAVHLTALDTALAGTDTFSRWSVGRLRVGDSVEIRALTTQNRGDRPVKVTRHKLPTKREEKRNPL
jgi:hypothetical protein